MDLSDHGTRIGRRGALRWLATAAGLLWPGLLTAQTGTGSVRPSGRLPPEGGRPGIGESRLVEFETSPFPYDGMVPELGKPFLDATSGSKRGHTSPRGGVNWEDKAYSDRRSLLLIPRGFDLNRPGLMVVYMHGNQATLERDVRQRQQVPRQVEQSGLNAVLVAPQFGSNVLDSSAGRFWEPGVFDRYLDEAAGRLAALYGDPSAQSHFNSMDVVIVAYSGGYQPAAYALQVGGANSRIKGVILLDALYAETERFAQWVRGPGRGAFFVSVHSASTRPENQRLQRSLEEAGIAIQTGLPARIGPGTVAIHGVGGEVVHNDFVTRAWTADPLKALLARASGYARSVSAPRRASVDDERPSRPPGRR